MMIQEQWVAGQLQQSQKLQGSLRATCLIDEGRIGKFMCDYEVMGM